MKNLSIMIKPASSLCNLRCRYCFYTDVAELRRVHSFGRMTEETTQKILETIRAALEPGDRLTLAFQGGEPTLAGLDYFRRVTETVRGWNSGASVRFSLQTNAVLLDEEWCRFLAQEDFLLGVSCDLLPDCHDAARVDAGGAGTYAQVTRAIRLLEKHGVQYNVLCTLTNQIARHPQQVWKKLEQLGVQYVQFTPCLAGLESASDYALTPQRFASFYTQLFRLWYAEFRKGNYRSVKLFDDVVNLLAYGVPTACGMGGVCQPQLVVEADGSVYPCDFYCLEEYCLGNLTQNSVRELLAAPAAAAFTRRAHTAPEKCKACRYAAFCGGGCKRMQKETCCAGDAQFCGYAAFLDECLPQLLEIARMQRRMR